MHSVERGDGLAEHSGAAARARLPAAGHQAQDRQLPQHIHCGEPMHEVMVAKPCITRDVQNVIVMTCQSRSQSLSLHRLQKGSAFHPQCAEACSKACTSGMVTSVSSTLHSTSAHVGR